MKGEGDRGVRGEQVLDSTAIQWNVHQYQIPMGGKQLLYLQAVLQVPGHIGASSTQHANTAR